jgi:hypothetical protein
MTELQQRYEAETGQSIRRPPMERKLNEQWIEELDGKRHMLKAVPPIHLCSGCVFSNKALCSDPLMSERDIDCSKMIVKDLGILNDDGLLPCPFCGEYPLVENAYEGVSGHNTPDGFWRISCFGKNHEMAFFSGKTRQQAIDAWNRRA